MTNDSNLNVKHAGAKGDGKTDDTAVFQKLLDLAAESQATVEVPPGTYTSITGNMIYRSGRPIWNRTGEDCSAHIVLIGARGMTVTGNTMVAGLDDENNEGSTGFSKEENWSPEYGVVTEGLRNAVIKDNVMDSGALKELILDRGGHGPGVIIKDNPGELFQKQTP